MFDALAHFARRQILLILHARGGAMTAGEVAGRFKHAWPTTTRHLRVLEDAGLIACEREGRNRLYALRRERLRGAAAWLGSWVLEPSGGAREAWRDLPYATMRNTLPPVGGGATAST